LLGRCPLPRLLLHEPGALGDPDPRNRNRTDGLRREHHGRRGAGVARPQASEVMWSGDHSTHASPTPSRSAASVSAASEGRAASGSMLSIDMSPEYPIIAR